MKLSRDETRIDKVGVVQQQLLSAPAYERVIKYDWPRKIVTPLSLTKHCKLAKIWRSQAQLSLLPIMTTVPNCYGNVAAVLEQTRARLKTIDRPIPKPGPDEIVVRNHASM
jgi:hypothetical protein